MTAFYVTVIVSILLDLTCLEWSVCHNICRLSYDQPVTFSLEDDWLKSIRLRPIRLNRAIRLRSIQLRPIFGDTNMLIEFDRSELDQFGLGIWSTDLVQSTLRQFGRDVRSCVVLCCVVLCCVELCLCSSLCLSLCLCLCLYVCVCVCLCLYVCVCVHMCMSAYVHVCMNACAHVCICTRVRSSILEEAKVFHFSRAYWRVSHTFKFSFLCL